MEPGAGGQQRRPGQLYDRPGRPVAVVHRRLRFGCLQLGHRLRHLYLEQRQLVRVRRRRQRRAVKCRNIAHPAAPNNSQIYNLIYTYNADPWIIQPYFQATHVPANSSVGISSSASTFGGAILANYDLGAGFNLGGRLEYIGSTGGNSLLYGPGSGAFSATITPTFQWQYYFARAEFSYVKANGVTSGFGLGPNFNGNSQTRVMVETGILF